MAGMFGRSAAVREKALSNPQPYSPLFTPEGFIPTGPIDVQPNVNIDTPRLPSIKPKIGAFDRGGMGWQVIGAIGDSLSQMGGYGAPFAQARNLQREQEYEDALWTRRQNSELAQQKELYDYKLAHPQPRYFSGKEDQLSYDPATGNVTTLYDAPEPYEAYASAMGYDPGSPEYRGALSDYVLRSYGPTAEGVRANLLDQRLEGQQSLEALRQRNRLQLKQTPGAPRPRGNGYGHSGGTVGAPRTTGNVYAPILAKIARGESLSAGEQRVMDLRGGGGRRSSSASMPTATGPGGKKVAWNGTAWVPAN